MIYYFQTHLQYVAVLCGLIIAFPIVWRHRERIGVKHPIPVLGICVYFLFASLISAWAFAFLEARISGFAWRVGSISVLGEYLICPLLLLAFAAICRLKKKGLFDSFAICAVITLVFMRINCIRAGCCYGVLIPGTEFRYPVREIEIVFYILMFIWFIYKERKGYAEGTFFPFLMMTYGILRFILEWFRDAYAPYPFHLHLAHIWAIMAAVIGAVIYFMMIKKSGRNLPEEEA